MKWKNKALLDIEHVQKIAAITSRRLNMLVETIVAALLMALVLDVWLGVADRYILHWQLPWPEVLARFLLIWSALLAVSSGIARREHVALSILFDRLPVKLQRLILLAFDLITLSLFAYLFWYGLDFAEKGAGRQAQIFGATLLIPFAVIPVASFLAIVQTVLVAIRDFQISGHTENGRDSST